MPVGNNMIGFLEKHKCTGCGACMNSCPSGHIRMVADHYGFLYPMYDNENKCLNCGQCVSSCPVLSNNSICILHKESHAYAAWSLDDDVRLNSSSGGIFTELAKQILRQKGYVIGAAFNKEHLVEHVLIDNEQDLPSLRQSKYIQSDTNNIFCKVKSALHTNHPVLFTGTPCQCAGLRSFLKEEYVNLIVCDFICHGVNSPMVYRKYVSELENKYGATLTSITFRDKSYGWNNSSIKIIFVNGKEYLCGHSDDPFMYGFVKKGLNLYQRPSCGQCTFKGVNRPVDITMGDFWGIDLPDHAEKEKGVSAILIHSQKGEAFFKSIEKNVFFELKNIDDVVRNNPCLVNSAVTKDIKGTFYSNLLEMAFSDAVWSTERKIREQEGEIVQ